MRPSLVKAEIQVIVTVETDYQEKEIYGTVDQLDSTGILMRMHEDFETDDALKIHFVNDRIIFQMEYSALEMMDHNVVESMMFPQPPTVNEQDLEFSR